MSDYTESTEELILRAKTTLDSIQRDRAQITRIKAEDATDEWFTSVFGTRESRIASIDGDISYNREILKGLQTELISRGCTQGDIRQIWGAMQADLEVKVQIR